METKDYICSNCVYYDACQSDYEHGWCSTLDCMVKWDEFGCDNFYAPTLEDN